MEQIDNLITPLTKYARSLTKYNPHIDYRDVVNSTILKLLQIHPDKLNIMYACTICKSKYIDLLRQPIDRKFNGYYEYTINYYSESDPEELEEKELLLAWAEEVIKNSDRRIYKVGYSMTKEAIKKRKYLDKKRNANNRSSTG